MVLLERLLLINLKQKHRKKFDRKRLYLLRPNCSRKLSTEVRMRLVCRCSGRMETIPALRWVFRLLILLPGLVMRRQILRVCSKFGGNTPRRCRYSWDIVGNPQLETPTTIKTIIQFRLAILLWSIMEH